MALLEIPNPIRITATAVNCEHCGATVAFRPRSIMVEVCRVIVTFENAHRACVTAVRVKFRASQVIA